MKLICLNTWGGRVHQPLLNFLEENKDVDVFCFQEIYREAPHPIVEDKGDRLNLFSEIEGVLSGHQGSFRPDFENWFGQAMFTKKDLFVAEEKSLRVFEIESEQKGNHSRHLQCIHVQKNEMDLTVANVHGLWNGKGKTDTEERLEQSRRIKTFMENVGGRKILCGDFNLLPGTESIKILDSMNMRNLIHMYGVTSTRTSLYTKPDKFADYMFVSQEIKVNDFRVLPDEISDHAALYLDFE